MTSILTAALLSLIAGLAAGLGGVAVALLPRLDMRLYDTLLGFAAGVMSAVATIGLIQQALGRGGTGIVLLGVAAGAAILFALDRKLPHEHEPLSFECTNPMAYRRGILLFSALTLHNLPEGLAVGTGFVAQPRLGLLLALAIALHNIPEGIAVAGPFRACGMPRRQYLAWAVVSGLAEPVAALVGASFVTFFQAVLPFSLAFAGGAMLYVVSDELIPESHSHGYEHEATFGFVSGFLLLLALSQLL
ncbi:MAG TPA: ZIP family metal transporter [Anaerolineae bacterium]|nr:ZIP family metal transporter [Anaerolineae bacterium]